MTEAEFKRLAAQGFNRIPVVLETFADLDTPLSIYLKLANKPYSYLLESVQGGERFGRYSFIGLAGRDAHRSAAATRCCDAVAGTASPSATTCGDPLAFVNQLPAALQGAALPRPAALSAAAWSATSATTPCATSRRDSRRRAGRMRWARPTSCCCCRRSSPSSTTCPGKLTLVVYAEPEVPRCLPAGARAAAANCCATLRAPVADSAGSAARGRAGASRHSAKRGFIAAVERAKHYIFDGDIMQVVLSQRMTHAVPRRAAGAVPRAAHAQSLALHVLFRLRAISTWSAPRRRSWCGWKATRSRVRPIAGTRPRGATRGGGRGACEPNCSPTRRSAPSTSCWSTSGATTSAASPQTGSVQVTENMVIERYSHVMHIVSNVEGKLRAGWTRWTCCARLSRRARCRGAPKVRAMEIIDELEPVQARHLRRRGRLSRLQRRHGPRHRHPHRAWSRTACCTCRPAPASSPTPIPTREWQETQNKARRVLRAAEMAAGRPRHAARLRG